MKEFKHIKGYEGLYQINIDGVVRRLHKDKRSTPYKVLKLSTRSGYYFYTLSGKKHTLHRLIMTNYTDNPNNLPCINHIDGNRLNNNINNLEWCTHKHNTQHAIKTGLMKPSNTKIPKSEYDKIRSLRLSGLESSEIASMYGVGYNCIYRIYRKIKDGI